jgi:hypothetical protein
MKNTGYSVKKKTFLCKSVCNDCADLHNTKNSKTMDIKHLPEIVSDEMNSSQGI